MSKIKLYLDIDGVLLQKDGRIPQDAEDFCAFVTANFDCYWLTTHCKGDSATALRYLSRYYSPTQLSCLKPIQPTDWETLKTEAIDFNDPFIWLDDQPFMAERGVLDSKGYSNALVIVDLKQKEELKRVKAILLHSLSQQ